MSAIQRTLPTRLATTATERLVRRSRLPSAARTVLTPVQAAAFWIAALLPLTYVPLLATGAAGEHALWFTALLTANVAAFVLGHSYGRRD